MKLPNAAIAFVDMQKLTDYCLSPDHPRGKHKARVFRSACGFTVENADLFLQQLLDAAENGDAMQVTSDVFGRRFVIEYIMGVPANQARVRTAWIIKHDEEFPRFVSAYVM
jgi:hypothetical protein